MLRIVECEYPNPEYKYGIFYLDDYEIGRASKVESGWIPTGKRKAMPEEMAAKVMIDSIISMARRDEAHARKMLDALRAYCGEARSEPASCACQRSHGTNGWGSGDVQPLYALTPEDVAAVNKSRKEAAWKAARRLDLCQCDHTEYCRHCLPLEFRPSGVWGGPNA